MNRFKMSFNNSGLNPPQYYNNIGANIAVKSASMPSVNKISLNAPMIDRVHKAKPGCSACGKKVA